MTELQKAVAQLYLTQPTEEARSARMFWGVLAPFLTYRWIVLPHPLAKRCCLSCIHAHIFLSWEILSRAAIPWECSDHCFANVWKDESFSKSWDREKNQKIRDGVISSHSCICRICLFFWLNLSEYRGKVFNGLVRCSPAGITLALHWSSTPGKNWWFLNTRCASVFAQWFHDLLSFKLYLVYYFSDEPDLYKQSWILISSSPLGKSDRLRFWSQL